MKEDWMKIHRHPTVLGHAQPQVARLTGHERREMNLRIRAGDGRPVEFPGREGCFVTTFGYPRRLKVLWRLREDKHTPIIMSVIDAGGYQMSYQPTCCHKTRPLGASCPLGWACPYDETLP